MIIDRIFDWLRDALPVRSPERPVDEPAALRSSIVSPVFDVWGGERWRFSSVTESTTAGAGDIVTATTNSGLVYPNGYSSPKFPTPPLFNRVIIAAHATHSDIAGQLISFQVRGASAFPIMLFQTPAAVAAGIVVPCPKERLPVVLPPPQPGLLWSFEARRHAGAGGNVVLTVWFVDVLLGETLWVP